MNNEKDTSSDINQAPTSTDELKSKLIFCETERNEWRERCMRLTADLDNVKKRTAREQAMWLESTQMKVFADLLPVVDDLDRAIKQATVSVVANWVEGFVLIRASFLKTLQSFGVEPMKEYGLFDPALHEAVTSVKSPDHAPGHIITVFQEGYLFNGRVLRPAKVSVAA